ncbi:MAG: ATP-binding protein [Kiritimatiellae bacterium]|nr:ATP-binding protein [Kiritimatiellia bacterium]
MKRSEMEYLVAWRDSPRRKPLVLRGARQVGKSYLCREFARAHFDALVEINFELTPNVADLFADKSPENIVPRLELHAGTKITAGKTLLFLDEVQAVPEVFACLRYFHERMPSLHVMAAGSLLEFVLEEHDFSMPVGRIEYFHLGPMRYEEYLSACGRSHLCEFLQQYAVGTDIPASLHQDLLNSLREFLVVGGMPEAVQAYVDTKSFLECDKVKQSILSTYTDDFSKYAKRVNTQRVQRVFQRLPHLVGGKFKHTRVDRNEQARAIGQALRLLCLARIAYKVHHSGCNGVPLGAEIDERKFKVIFLDVGLLCKACGLSLLEFERAEDVLLVNAGAVCEQFTGQHLLYAGPHFEDPALHYWSREKRQSSAEVDYVMSVGPHVVPVEIKAGKSGKLKSLHLFLKEKQRAFAVRFDTGVPSLLDYEAVLPTREKVPCRLLSLPLYLVGQARALCRQQFVSA